MDGVARGECTPPRLGEGADEALVASASEDQANGAAAAGTLVLTARMRSDDHAIACLAYNLRIA